MSALNSAKEWWSTASNRDQLFVIIGGVFLIIFLLYTVVLKPVRTMATTELAKVEAQKASLDRIRILAAQVKKSKKGSRSKGRSVETVVETSISQHGLRVSGFDASGKSGIRVRFDKVEFDKLLGWINELEVKKGLSMKDISISQAKEQGVVSANLLIQGS